MAKYGAADARNGKGGWKSSAFLIQRPINGKGIYCPLVYLNGGKNLLALKWDRMWKLLVYLCATETFIRTAIDSSTGHMHSFLWNLLSFPKPPSVYTKLTFDLRISVSQKTKSSLRLCYQQNMTLPPSSPLLYLLFVSAGTPAWTVRYYNTELLLTHRLPHTSRPWDTWVLWGRTVTWTQSRGTDADFAVTLKGPRRRGLGPGRETGTSVLLFQG